MSSYSSIIIIERQVKFLDRTLAKETSFLRIMRSKFILQKNYQRVRYLKKKYYSYSRALIFKNL